MKDFTISLYFDNEGLVCVGIYDEYNCENMNSTMDIDGLTKLRNSIDEILSILKS